MVNPAPQAESRMNAENALRDRVAKLRRQADELEQLADAVAGLDGPAERALWLLVVSQK